MKKLFLTAIAFGSLIGIGANGATTKASTNTWHAGTPKVFHTKYAGWISNYNKIKDNDLKDSYGKHATYERETTGIDAKDGFNPVGIVYNANKKAIGNGADESAVAAVNPHYMSLGHGYYKLTSGAMGKNSLKNELSGNMSKMFGSTTLIKVYNSNKIKVWNYDSYSGNGKIEHGEIFHRNG